MQRWDRFRFDGMQVPVEISGDGSPLVFLPGLGVHPRYYGEGIGRLANHFTVFVPDLSFRTHADLPGQVERYRALAEELADHYAPAAFRVGHSFGGFLALLGSVPAIALSPLIPLAAGWSRKVGRALRLQAREYLGLEGRRGPGWAWAIFRDYVGTAVSRPASLFPAVSDTLHCLADRFRPTAPVAHVVLAEYDRLYHLRESETFLARAERNRVIVRRVRQGHAWPVTHPDLLEVEVTRAMRADAGRRAAAEG